MNAIKTRAGTLSLAKPRGNIYGRERAARSLDRGIFFSLLLIIALAAATSGTAEPWWEAIFECGIFALTIAWIGEGQFRATWLVAEHRLLGPLLLLAAFALLQSLPLWSAPFIAGVGNETWNALSASPDNTQLAALKLFALTLAGGLLLRYTNNHQRLRTLIHVIVGIGFAAALFGICRHLLERRASGPVFPGLSPGEGYGQFGNPNHFAVLMEMVFGLLLGLLMHVEVRRAASLLYGVAVIPVWAALVLTNSRGAIFSMSGQLLFTAILIFTLQSPGKFLMRQVRSRGSVIAWLQRAGRLGVVQAALIACLLVAVGFGTMWVGGEPLVRRLRTVPGEFSAEGRMGASRLEIWRATWRLIKANPIMGVGFGAFGVAIPRYHDATGQWTPQEAHNDYLETLASGGVVGGALAAWFFASFIKQARARLRLSNSFRRAACIGALIGLFGVAIHSLVDFGLHIEINALIFIALMVIAVANVGSSAASGNRELSS